MVIPAHCAFESLENDGYVALLAPITALLHIEDVLVLKVDILSDNHGPDHSMAMAYSPKSHTHLACEDITSIAPQTPVVVGNILGAEIADHICRIRWFAQTVSVCEALEALERQRLATVVKQRVSYTTTRLRMYMQPFYTGASDCLRQLESLREASRHLVEKLIGNGTH